jgi:hypothetical protein
MNRLREKIRQASDNRPAALGFAAVGREKSPSLLLFVRGSKNAVAGVAGVVDGYVVNSAGERPSESAEALRGLVAEDGKLPTGGEFDFLLLDEQTPASALLSEDLSYLMRADVGMTDSVLRALHALPLEGLLVECAGPLTVGSQVALMRVSGFTGKPLFVEVKEMPSSSDLEVLREAGAIAVVASADLGAGRLTELKQAIAGLPPRRKPRRDEREPVALVGQVPPGAGEDEDIDVE